MVINIPYLDVLQNNDNFSVEWHSNGRIEKG